MLICVAFTSICPATFGQELVKTLPEANSWESAAALLAAGQYETPRADALSIASGELWIYVELEESDAEILHFPSHAFDRYRILSSTSDSLLFDSGMRNPNLIIWSPETKISLSRNQGSSFFIHIESAADDYIPFAFLTLKDYEVTTSPQIINIGMYYGSILLMSAFCLLLSFFNKDPDAWKLAIAMLVWMLPSMAIWGYGYAPLPYNLSELLGGAINQLVVLASITSAWFSYNFLASSAGHTRIYKGLTLIIGLQIAYFLATFIFGISWAISVILILISTILGALTALVAALNRDKAARYMAAASVCSSSPFIFLFINPLDQQSSIGAGMLALTFVMLALMQRVGERFHTLGRQAKVASERERFLASMSHEIRTPLNGIIGFSELCNQENLQGEVKEYFQQIDRSSKMLLGIVNDVLDYSKLQATDVKVASESMSIEDTLKDVITINKPIADLNRIELSYEIADDVGEYLLTDPYRCAQIIINLCSNAVKFSHDGNVLLKVSLDKQDILFQVIDDGIGIEENVLASLFNPFSQADASTARKFGGTGLGLAISKQLCELLGGTLTAVSIEGQGSEFTCRLPYREGDTPISPTDANVSKLAGKRVLLAEDNAVNLQLATRILEKNGLTIDSATDGKIALEKATHNDYDFILMDMQMPELSGTETTVKIREMGISRPIIAMTANTSASDREACIDAGMNDFLAKPIEQQQLLKKLELWSATI